MRLAEGQNLRIPFSLQREHSKKIRNMTFRELLHLRFLYYLQNDIPIKILDAASGWDAGSSFKLDEFLKQNGIKAEITTVDPKIVDEKVISYIRKAQDRGIVVIKKHLQSLRRNDENKNKFHIIKIDSPTFLVLDETYSIHDVDFLGLFNFLLATNGIVIIRHRADFHGNVYDNLLLTIIQHEYGDKWQIQKLAYGSMTDLPRGSAPVLAPIIIERLNCDL